MLVLMYAKTVEQLLAAELIEELGYNRYIGRIICTTNAAEGCRRQLRKRTKSKSMFPTPQAARKLVYLATIDITQ